MEFHLPILFFIFSILSLGSYADLTPSPEVYWKIVLPDTSMPKAISDSLHPEWMDEDGNSVTVGKGGIGLITGKGNLTPLVVNVYTYAATKTQLRHDPNVTIFFLEKDLKPGTKMTLHFPRSRGTAAFLPREVAASIPFSTSEFSTILRRFMVAPGSEEASVMKQTIKECEQSNNVVLGEEKYCATSLESMVDFAASRLGAVRGIEAVSTETDSDDGKRKEFVVRGVREVGRHGGEVVACHKGKYPYAVFYCHKMKRTVAYTVELGAEDKVVDAVAVCHEDTSVWNPKHLAFQLLKVKPGSDPICHFLPGDNLIWVRN